MLTLRLQGPFHPRKPGSRPCWCHLRVSGSSVEESFYEHHLLGMKGGCGALVGRIAATCSLRTLPLRDVHSHLTGSLVLLQKRISGGLSVKQTWAHKAE